MTIKIGNCYIARFTKNEMPVRIESQKANGIWISRSLTHGRIVFVKNESQLIRECNSNDLAEYAKTVMPNRRSKRQPPAPVLATEMPHAAPVRRAKPKRQSVPEFGLTLVEAAYRILRESKKPLASQEIVDRAFKKKYHRSSGATPANTLNAAIIRIIKRDGENSRFVKVGRGLFSAR
ncbi:MAG: winged helix-turn-helix domain-containing protein [Planctomycetaceae bacterium]|nr:winged helix-turn-helix domain-containing protein [Planctomycetaceae bacterium]